MNLPGRRFHPKASSASRLSPIHLAFSKMEGFIAVSGGRGRRKGTGASQHFDVYLFLSLFNFSAASWRVSILLGKQKRILVAPKEGRL